MHYFNDPELNGEYMGTITKDFTTFSTRQPGTQLTQTKSRSNTLLLLL